MINIQKPVRTYCTQLAEFGDKYTPVKPSPQSISAMYPSPPKVFSCLPYYYGDMLFKWESTQVNSETKGWHQQKHLSLKIVLCQVCN